MFSPKRTNPGLWDRRAFAVCFLALVAGFGGRFAGALLTKPWKSGIALQAIYMKLLSSQGPKIHWLQANRAIQSAFSRSSSKAPRRQSQTKPTNDSLLV